MLKFTFLPAPYFHEVWIVFCLRMFLSSVCIHFRIFFIAKVNQVPDIPWIQVHLCVTISYQMSGRLSGKNKVHFYGRDSVSYHACYITRCKKGTMGSCKAHKPLFGKFHLCMLLPPAQSFWVPAPNQLLQQPVQKKHALCVWIALLCRCNCYTNAPSIFNNRKKQ